MIHLENSMKKQSVPFIFAVTLLAPFALNVAHADASDQPRTYKRYNSNKTPTVPAPEICEPDVHSDMVYFKHIEGKGYGYNEGYSTFGAFITPYSNFSNILPFLDLRGHVFNRRWKFAANAGVGFKWLTDSPFVFGAAGYYDYRQTKRGHYNQVGLSLEFLMKRWEFRANGYLPVGEKTLVRKKSEVASYNFEKFSGYSMYYSTTYDIHRNIEYAMKGVDGEVGFHLMKPHEFYTVYLGLGPYYFHSPHHIRKHAIGGMARIQARITPYLTLQVSNSWDTLFHNNCQGEIAVNIPFGGRILKKNAEFDASCCDILSMEARMVQPMHRNEIIVADKKNEHYYKTVDPIAQSIYGGPLDFIFVNANAPTGGNGTFENPFNDLQAAHNLSLPNNVLYVMSDLDVTYDVILMENQSLLGSGIPQIVPIAVAPNQVGFVRIPALTSTTPALTQDNGSNSMVYITGDNTVISGFTFNGGPSETSAIIANTIAGSSTLFPISNFTLVNNTFNCTSEDGIDLSAASGNFLFENNVFNGNGTGGIGISFDEEAVTGGAGSYVAYVTVQNNTFNDFTVDGVWIASNYSSAGASVVTGLVQNNVFTNSGFYGLEAGAGGPSSSANATLNITVINNTFTGNASGIAFESYAFSTLNATACNNIASSNTDMGIKLHPVQNSNSNFVICDNILNSNGNAGLGYWDLSQSITDVSVTALITGNTVKFNPSAGMIFNTEEGGTLSAKITFENNILIDNGDGYEAGYSFYFLNNSDSTTTLFMNGNENTSFKYALVNQNSDNGSFNIEKGGVNFGIIDQIGSGPDPFNIVDRHTAAP